MVMYKKSHIIDELIHQENALLVEWDLLPSIYHDDGSIHSKNYENLAGAINYIRKCKEMIQYVK